LYFRTVRVYECNVSAVATRRPAIEIEVFDAKEEDIRRLAALVSSAPADWIGRQARGSTCLIARAGSTYHGYLWITRGMHRVREGRRQLKHLSRPRWGNGFDLFS